MPPGGCLWTGVVQDDKRPTGIFLVGLLIFQGSCRVQWKARRNSSFQLGKGTNILASRNGPRRKKEKIGLIFLV